MFGNKLVFLVSLTGVSQSPRSAVACPRCQNWSSRALISQSPLDTAGSRTAKASWTTTTTSAPTTTRSICVLTVGTSPFTPNGHGYALKDATFTGPGRIHSIVDREVPADQVRPHSCILTGQCLGLVCCVSLVLSVVDTRDAGVAALRTVCFVMRVWPLTPTAKTCLGHIR